MKKVLVLWFLLLLASASALPVEDVRLTGYVNDYTNTLSPQESQAISNIAQSLQQQGVAELAVVIVDNFDGMTREQYAVEIAHENLGDTEEDNGVLILIGLKVREYRIEIGYGLEGILNDAKVGRMGRELLVPNFQAQQYGQGILELTQAIGYELLPEGIPPPQNYTTDEGSSGIAAWFIFILVFFIIRAISYARYRKKHYTDSDVDDAFTAAMFASWFFRPPKGGAGGSGGFGSFGEGSFGGGGGGGSF